MLTLLRIKELYFLLESVAIKGIPISQSPHYPNIIKITRQILESFGITRNKKFEALLIQYIYNSEYTDHFVNDVVNYLTKMSEKKLSGDIDDFIPAPNCNHLNDEDDLTDEEKEIFEKESELEWQDIEAQRENRFKTLQSMPRTMEPEAVKQYLIKHLEFPISDKELDDIVIGFQLRWNYSNPQMAGDLDFQHAVDQYLTAIESPMDREKKEKVVDSILEYLQVNRLWGYPQ